MSTYAKFPALPGSSSAPPMATFTPVFAGQGTADLTVHTAAYRVLGGVMELIVFMSNAADGDGVAPFTMLIPGGYTVDGSLIPDSDTPVGTFGGVSVSFATSSTLQFGLVSGFALGDPLTGSDLSLGAVYSIRASFPVV